MIKPVKILTWLFLFSFVKLLAANAHAPTFSFQSPVISSNIASRFISKDEKATPLLRELLLLYNIQAETLDEIVVETQIRWIAIRQGTGGLERRDIVDTPAQTALRDKTFYIAKKLGLFEKSKPHFNHYTYSICLGAFLESARGRLALLIDAWKQGIRFDWLIFLGSDRPLRSREGENEEFAIFCNPDKSLLAFRPDWVAPILNDTAYKTEYDMLKLIWDQTDVPQDMREHLRDKVVFINAKSTLPGKRASTADSYAEWLSQYHPQPGLILAASSPLVGYYQHLVGNNVLGADYPLNTIHSAANPNNMRVSIILDTIAKCLYEIKIYRKTLKS